MKKFSDLTKLQLELELLFKRFEIVKHKFKPNESLTMQPEPLQLDFENKLRDFSRFFEEHNKEVAELKNSRKNDR